MFCMKKNYIFSSISLRTHLYAFGQPQLITWHQYRLCPRVILFVRIFFPSVFSIRLFGFFTKNKFSCNCLHMHFYSFGQPSLTTWHPYLPSLTNVQFNWCSNVCWFFIFFPIKTIDFLYFVRNTFSTIFLRTHLYAVCQPSLTTWHPYPLCPRVIFLRIFVFSPIKTVVSSCCIFF